MTGWDKPSNSYADDALVISVTNTDDSFDIAIQINKLDIPDGTAIPITMQISTDAAATDTITITKTLLVGCAQPQSFSVASITTIALEYETGATTNLAYPAVTIDPPTLLSACYQLSFSV